jgi:hypothetical protein
VLQAIESGEISIDLISEALSRIGFPSSPNVVPFVLKRTEELLAYQVEHSDGLVVTYLRMQKWVGEWVVAVRTNDGAIKSCGVDAGGAFDFFGNFAWLNARVDEFFESGQAPTPIMRTHLSAGVLEDLLHALKEGPAWRETPRLQISY